MVAGYVSVFLVVVVLFLKGDRLLCQPWLMELKPAAVWARCYSCSRESPWGGINQEVSSCCWKRLAAALCVGGELEMVCPWCHAHGQAQLAAPGGLPELLGRGQVHARSAPCGEGTSTVPHACSQRWPHPASRDAGAVGTSVCDSSLCWASAKEASKSLVCFAERSAISSNSSFFSRDLSHNHLLSSNWSIDLSVRTLQEV